MIQPKVELSLSPHEFFRDILKKSSKKNSVALNNDLEFYLVNLLCHFIEPKSYFSVEEDIDFLNTPLALILKKALESSPDRQLLLYKLLGDTSLYLCGLFEESLEKKRITSDYVISLGSQAYENVSILMRTNKRDSDFNRIYSSLASDFNDIVKVLSSVSRETFRANKIESLLKKIDGSNLHSPEKILLEFEEQGICDIQKNNEDFNKIK